MRKRSGFILVLAILFLALLELLAISVALRVPQGLRGAARLGDETAAYLAAEAGVQDTIAWLEFQLETGAEPEVVDRIGVLGEDSWTVQIEPDKYTYPKGHHSCRCYTLRGEGHHASQTRRIQVSIVQESFGRYARFVDHWPAVQDPATDVYYWAGRIHVNGPVHSNETLHIAAVPAFYQGSERFPHLFDTDWVSSVEPVQYQGAAPADDSQTRLLYSRIEPSKTPRRVEKISMPSLISLESHTRAEGAVPGDPPLRIYPNGGLYINGNVDEMLMESSGSTSTQTFRMGPKTYQLVEHFPNLGATLSGPGVSQQVDGHLNGLVYVNGSVFAFEGVNGGEHTLVTDIIKDHVNSITLTGNVTNAQGAHLGLITDHLVLPEPAKLPRTTVQLQAALYLVGKDHDGGFVVKDILAQPDIVGHLEIFGCLIEGTRVRCADVPNNSGWNVEVDFNSKARHNPAPFFPALPRFEVTAIQAEQR